MKAIVIGATGIIGKKVTAALAATHEIITAASNSGDYRVDMTNPSSIEQLFTQTGRFDALICTAGNGHFGPLREMNDAAFRTGVNNKLMGQVNLVLIGQHYVNAGGSFTLTSGVVAEDPIKLAANLTAVNNAVEGFVKAAAIELSNGVRINAVSPSLVEDAPHFIPFFPGQIPVSMHRVEQAYLKAVLGFGTGQVIKVH